MKAWQGPGILSEWWELWKPLSVSPSVGHVQLWDPMDWSPPGSCPWNFPGKNTGLGCQGIFPTQAPNLCLLHPLYWQVDSLPLAPHGKAGSHNAFWHVFPVCPLLASGLLFLVPLKLCVAMCFSQSTEWEQKWCGHFQIETLNKK